MYFVLRIFHTFLNAYMSHIVYCYFQNKCIAILDMYCIRYTYCICVSYRYRYRIL